LKYKTARENAACSKAQLMENLLILLVVGYLMLAPIALIIAIVALVRARRGESSIRAVEAENLRLEMRLLDLVRSGAVPETEGEATSAEEEVAAAAPVVVPEPVKPMMGPQPPSVSVPPQAPVVEPAAEEPKAAAPGILLRSRRPPRFRRRRLSSPSLPKSHPHPSLW